MRQSARFVLALGFGALGFAVVRALFFPDAPASPSPSPPPSSASPSPSPPAEDENAALLAAAAAFAAGAGEADPAVTAAFAYEDGELDVAEAEAEQLEPPPPLVQELRLAAAPRLDKAAVTRNCTDSTWWTASAAEGALLQLLRTQFEEWERVYVQAYAQVVGSSFYQLAREQLVRDSDGSAFAQAGFWSFFPVLFAAPRQRVGAVFDGGKYSASIALLGKLPRRPCVVYSFGSNRAVDFEMAVLEAAPHCEVHIFDYTVAPQRLPEEARNHSRVFFYQAGLAPAPAFIKHRHGQLPGLRVVDIMRELGHDYVDIVKMDVEGAEHPFFDQGFYTPPCKRADGAATNGSSSISGGAGAGNNSSSDICYLPVGEVMAELHVNEGTATIFDLFESFNATGFRLVSMETNFYVAAGGRPTCMEAVWVKTDLWRDYAMSCSQRQRLFQAYSSHFSRI